MITSCPNIGFTCAVVMMPIPDSDHHVPSQRMEVMGDVSLGDKLWNDENDRVKVKWERMLEEVKAYNAEKDKFEKMLLAK